MGEGLESFADQGKVRFELRQLLPGAWWGVSFRSRGRSLIGRDGVFCEEINDGLGLDGAGGEEQRQYDAKGPHPLRVG